MWWSMVELQVIFQEIRYSLNLERRVSYLRGDTAIGKTSLIRLLNMAQANRSVSVKCNKRVFVLADNTPNYVIKEEKNCLFVSDDSLMIESSDWFNRDIIPSLVKNDSYILIINRADIETENIRFNNNVQFAVSSIYVLKSKGKEYWCSREVDEEVSNRVGFEEFLFNCDCILSEDKYGATALLKAYFAVDVISSGSKDNLINCVNSIIQGDKYKNVLIFVDCASYGQKLNLLKAVTQYSNINFYIDVNYESFEYMILMSNFFKDRFKLSIDEVNSYLSWERYFEEKLSLLSKDTFYKYIHGTELRSCYTSDCDIGCVNKHILNKCENYNSDDKLQVLFNKTLFDYLLKLPRKAR